MLIYWNFPNSEFVVMENNKYGPQKSLNEYLSEPKTVMN